MCVCMYVYIYIYIYMDSLRSFGIILEPRSGSYKWPLLSKFVSNFVCTLLPRLCVLKFLIHLKFLTFGNRNNIQV